MFAANLDDRATRLNAVIWVDQGLSLRSSAALRPWKVCQGILVYLNQTTQPSESEDDERSVRDGMVTPRFAAGAKAPACSLIAPRQLPAASSLGEQRWF